MDAGDDGAETAESSPSLELDELIPPRLEDAGLEECALPLESIQLAFLKAVAAAVAADGSAAPEGDDRLDGSCPFANEDSGVVAGALASSDETADDEADPYSRGDGAKAERSTDEVKDSPVPEMQKLEIGKSGSDLKS